MLAHRYALRLRRGGTREGALLRARNGFADVPPWPVHGDIVVTSHMDHPARQFGAAYVAATHPVIPRCGLFAHVFYEPDAFIERIRSDGARLLPPGGTGIGFDDLLESLPWKSIG